MKIEIGASEARTLFPKLLRKVKAGKSFTITKRGEAVADLVPSAEIRSKNRIAGVNRLRTFMLEKPVRRVNIKKLIGEGRT